MGAKRDNNLDGVLNTLNTNQIKVKTERKRQRIIVGSTLKMMEKLEFLKNNQKLKNFSWKQGKTRISFRLNIFYKEKHRKSKKKWEKRRKVLKHKRPRKSGCAGFGLEFEFNTILHVFSCEVTNDLSGRKHVRIVDTGRADHRYVCGNVWSTHPTEQTSSHSLAIDTDKASHRYGCADELSSANSSCTSSDTLDNCMYETSPFLAF